MKILVTGYGRGGKDTFCELTGMSFKSSSWACLDEVIWPMWGKDLYATKQECFDDRHSHRDVWFTLIKEFNTPDGAKLARIILSECDIYCGMRNHEELEACDKEGLFDLKIWVDASERVPPEPSSSMTITKDMCDYVVDNNKSLAYLEAQAKNLPVWIKKIKGGWVYE